MKAQIWEIYVCESALDAVHGFSHPILELYIPELKFTINDISCFVTTDNRYAPSKSNENRPNPKLIKEIELSDCYVDEIKKIIKGRSWYEYFRDHDLKKFTQHDLTD